MDAPDDKTRNIFGIKRAAMRGALLMALQASIDEERRAGMRFLAMLAAIAVGLVGLNVFVSFQAEE
ncbi:MAG TPA: hypothetical protein PK970_12005 [Hyphomicrobiaceae bacterium]|nr:hypothetical protein [Hyphomicrobiaceae bacterium]